jgi:hypothetical protein
MRELLKEILLHKGTRWAFVFMMIMATIMMPSMKSCSGLGFNIEFAEEAVKDDYSEYADIDSLDIDNTYNLLYVDSLHMDSMSLDTTRIDTINQFQ